MERAHSLEFKKHRTGTTAQSRTDTYDIGDGEWLAELEAFGEAEDDDPHEDFEDDDDIIEAADDEELRTARNAIRKILQEREEGGCGATGNDTTHLIASDPGIDEIEQATEVILQIIYETGNDEHGAEPEPPEPPPMPPPPTPPPTPPTATGTTTTTTVKSLNAIPPDANDKAKQFMHEFTKNVSNSIMAFRDVAQLPREPCAKHLSFAIRNTDCGEVSSEWVF